MRRKFIARQCLEIDEKYVSKGMQCDEYPFSSTEERGSPTNSNFSVKPVPREQNASQGGHVRAFYAKNRVTNGQRFAVRVIK